jgi:hypothetical protein
VYGFVRCGADPNAAMNNAVSLKWSDKEWRNPSSVLRKLHNDLTMDADKRDKINIHMRSVASGFVEWCEEVKRKQVCEH